MLKVVAGSLMLLALGGCMTASEGEASQIGEAQIADAAGNMVGTARLYTLGDELSINVALQMPAGGGVHAMHLHQTGTCGAPGFESAGSHLNPAGNQHGSLNPQGPHLGDLPNVTLSASGAGTASAALSGTRDALLAQIFDGDGTAIIVHAAPDDYRTDPTGGAGSRVACGVLQRS